LKIKAPLKIARNVDQVAQGTKKISRNIFNVLEATSDARVKLNDV
jgi:hypothetical protein